MEPISNIGFVCETHAPKPGKYKGQPPENFVGKLIKLGFPCKIPNTNTDSTEHMWLKVLDVSSDGSLVGELDNDPVMDYGGIELFKDKEPECGDVFSFEAEEIEDVA